MDLVWWEVNHMLHPNEQDEVKVASAPLKLCLSIGQKENANPVGNMTSVVICVDFTSCRSNLHL
jgi:hypothetical protein